MYEAPSVIGTCINCIAHGSLSATLALIFIGAGAALRRFTRSSISPVATGFIRGGGRPRFLGLDLASQPEQLFVHPIEFRE
jgi:hypothetical protein